MTRYTCPNPACPRRSPVTAAEPPVCYTCGGKMAAVLRFQTEPYIYESDFFTLPSSSPYVHTSEYGLNDPMLAKHGHHRNSDAGREHASHR